MARSLAVLLIAALACTAQLAPAQTSDGVAEPNDVVWNSGRALELVRRAQELRSTTMVDTALVSYQADARGYLYFYLDRIDTGERNLVKTDQVALEILWRSPNLSKQRIVGWRDEKTLPTNIHYHLDHLAVVHDNFGDLIRIGDGDEVRDVLHPVAPGYASVYEYRLADSLTLRLPGSAEPVRVYELRVRPRDLSQPALIGSIFVDRRSGALVRMDFTFTPASYRDRHLDYINISLDNGLWLGRFWLPNQQRVELRRQIPEFDLPAGTIIRASMRVGNYRFNEPLPVYLFAGAPVSVAPPEERESFPFEEGIHAELRDEGIGPTIELGDIRRQAIALAGRQALSGLPATRLRVGSASQVVRYNRAEGAALGVGLSHRVLPSTSVAVQGGWAFGAEHPILRGSVHWNGGRRGIEFAGFLNELGDVGGPPTASGVINSASTFLAGRDHIDPFHARGIELRAHSAVGSTVWLQGVIGLERQGSAETVTDFSFFNQGNLRAVQPIDAGDVVRGSIVLRRSGPAEAQRWVYGSLSLDAGVLDLDDPAEPPRRFTRVRSELGWGWRWDPAALALSFDAAAGITAGTLPRQELFLIGGRGTVPGFPYRGFGGDRFVTGALSLSGDLVRPWVRGRLRGGIGAVDAAGPGAAALEAWGATPMNGMRGSIGGGLGLFYDVLHIDVARGFGNRGVWELIIDTRRSFWDFL